MGHSTEITETPKYRYRLSSMGDSSAKYGNCEVCKKHCGEVFLQSVDRRSAYRDGWAGIAQTFGHRECLIAIRMQENEYGMDTNLIDADKDDAFWQKLEPLLVEAYADQPFSDATVKAIERLCPPVPVSDELKQRLEEAGKTL